MWRRYGRVSNHLVVLNGDYCSPTSIVNGCTHKYLQIDVMYKKTFFLKSVFCYLKWLFFISSSSVYSLVVVVTPAQNEKLIISHKRALRFLLSDANNIWDMWMITGTEIQHGIELRVDAEDSGVSQVLMCLNPLICYYDTDFWLSYIATEISADIQQLR